MKKLLLVSLFGLLLIIPASLSWAGNNPYSSQSGSKGTLPACLNNGYVLTYNSDTGLYSCQASSATGLTNPLAADLAGAGYNLTGIGNVQLNNGKVIEGDTTTGHTFSIDGYGTTGSAYVPLITITNGLVAALSFPLGFSLGNNTSILMPYDGTHLASIGPNSSGQFTFTDQGGSATRPQPMITRPVTGPATTTQYKIPKWNTGGAVYDLADGYTVGMGASDIPQLSATPGTPNGTKYMRDDGVWSVPTGTGTVTSSGTPTIHQWSIWTTSTNAKGVTMPANTPIVGTDANGEPTPTTTISGVSIGLTAGDIWIGSKQVNTAVFTGSGLNDATAGGTYTGTGIHTYIVQMTANGTPDTFEWNIDGGSWTTGVAVTGAAQTLSLGVQITFTATTGHTIGNYWTITAAEQATPAALGTGVATALEATPNAAGGVITYGNAAGNAAVLTGWTSGAGTVGAGDTILAGMQKIDGNVAAKTTAAAALAAAKGITRTVCSTDSAPATGRLFPMWRAPAASTITANHYIQIGATSLVGEIQICDANAANCANTQGSDTTATAGTDSDGTVTSGAVGAGVYVSMHETTLNGSTPTSYTACFDYTVN